MRASDFVDLCVCVCKRDRERQRERQRKRQRESVFVCLHLGPPRWVGVAAPPAAGEVSRGRLGAPCGHRPGPRRPQGVNVDHLSREGERGRESAATDERERCERETGAKDCNDM